MFDTSSPVDAGLGLVGFIITSTEGPPDRQVSLKILVSSQNANNINALFDRRKRQSACRVRVRRRFAAIPIVGAARRACHFSRMADRLGASHRATARRFKPEDGSRSALGCVLKFAVP
jgi:hypothetical protein